MTRILGGATIWARQTIDSVVFRDKPDKWFKIWFYIVNKVKYMKKGQFNRGENFIKYEWITESTGASKAQIDHFMRWAKQAQMLATQKATRGMTVNVLKYEFYQDLENYTSDEISDLKATQKRHRSDTILKNDKNDKNIYSDKSEEVVSPLEEKDKQGSAPWNSSAYIDKLIGSEREDVKIVGHYMKIKKLNFPSLKAAKAEFGRNIKSSGELAEYPKEKRSRAVKLAAQQTPQWTLLTVCKYINK